MDIGKFWPRDWKQGEGGREGKGKKEKKRKKERMRRGERGEKEWLEELMGGKER